MLSPQYRIRPGTIDQIEISCFGELSDGEAAVVLNDLGGRQAVVLEPVARAEKTAGWDEDAWRDAVTAVLGTHYGREPVWLD